MSEGYFLFSHASPLPQLCFSWSKWSSCWREPPSPPRPGTQDPECWMLVMNDKVQALPYLVFCFSYCCQYPSRDPQDLGGLPTPSALPFSLEILSASPLSWSPLQQQQTAWLYLASAVPAVAIEPEPTLSGDTQG